MGVIKREREGQRLRPELRYRKFENKNSQTKTEKPGVGDE